MTFLVQLIKKYLQPILNYQIHKLTFFFLGQINNTEWIIIRLQYVSMTKTYQMMKTKIWNIDQFYYLSNLLEKNGVGKNRQIAPLTSAWLQWWCVKGNSTVLLYYYLFILLFPIHLSQFRETLPTRYVLPGGERMQSEQIGERGKRAPASRAEARKNFWVMVLGTKGFPVLVGMTIIFFWLCFSNYLYYIC